MFCLKAVSTMSSVNCVFWKVLMNNYHHSHFSVMKRNLNYYFTWLYTRLQQGLFLQFYLLLDILFRSCRARPRLVTLDTLQCTKNSSYKMDRWKPNMTSLISDYRGECDVILGFYLSILGDDIFRKLKRIMSNPAYSIASGWAKFHPGAYSGICPGGLKLFFFTGEGSAHAETWKPPEIHRFHWSRGLSPHSPPWIRLWFHPWTTVFENERKVPLTDDKTTCVNII